MNNIPRPEHPKPQFVRDNWRTLNGPWEFLLENSDTYNDIISNSLALPTQINVPFCPESELSGIGYKDFIKNCIYARNIEIDANQLRGRVLLHIGACDYLTEVFVNGASVGTHFGGYTSFCFDITDELVEGSNRVYVKVYDDTRSSLQPSGKQSMEPQSYGCFYTRTTGIWQSVWLEFVPKTYISFFRCIPLIDESKLLIEVEITGSNGCELIAVASDGEAECARACVKSSQTRNLLTLQLSDAVLWEPSNPFLYGLTLVCGEDRVESYFGMRELGWKNGTMTLNGKNLFQRLVLDQGFYPDGICTAPSDQALIKDIRLSMDMGFNGARLHQKVFEERFLYHCDRLGYIVWGEYGNWGFDPSNPEAWSRFLPEWLEAVKRDLNHPSLIGWCPFNETDNTDGSELIKHTVDMTRAIDPTRPVIDTSGWYHTDNSDILDTHDYDQDPEQFRTRLEGLYEGEIICPVVGVKKNYTFVSEYGGIGWCSDEGWGYGDNPKTEDEFLQRYSKLTAAILENHKIFGFCYTQLTDVEQEQNGLYTYERQPKFDPSIIRAVNKEKAAFENE